MGLIETTLFWSELANLALARKPKSIPTPNSNKGSDPGLVSLSVVYTLL